MPVNFYVWGEQENPVNPDGGSSALAAAPFGTPEQFAGTAGVGDTLVNFTGPTKSVTVICPDDTNGFSISFDGGLNFIVFGAYGQRQFDVQVTSMILRATVAVDYEILAILA